MALHLHQEEAILAYIRKQHPNASMEQVIALWRQEALDEDESELAARKVEKRNEKAAPELVEPVPSSPLRERMARDPNYCPVPKKLARMSFVPMEKMDRLEHKFGKKLANKVCKSRDMIPLPTEYVKQFPAGIPGIPNILRPEELLSLWAKR